jgi:hypothetical protein
MSQLLCHWCRALAGLALLPLILSIPARAQTPSTGALVGLVKDQQGAGIPGARVVLTKETTGESRETVTDAVGNYKFTLLDPVTYTLVASAENFQTLRQTGVKVVVTETVTLDATLQAGGASETITVSAVGSIVQTEDVALGRVVTQRQAQELPLVTRNFTQILALSPGVVVNLPDSAAVGRGTATVSANGQGLKSNAYQLDGLDVTSFTSGNSEDIGPLVGVPIPSPEGIQEFKVQVSQYDASVGVRSGANVNVVTKSGGKEWHGSLFEFFRNDKLNANNFFFNATGTPRPVLRQNQFGGSLGGPVLKDRMFVFGLYQGTRQFNGADLVASTTFLSLPTELRGLNRASREALVAQLSARFGIAPEQLHPVALNLLQAQVPGGQFAIPEPLNSNVGINYTASVPSRFREDQFIINTDNRLSRKHALEGRWFFATAPRTLSFGAGATVPGFEGVGHFVNANLALTEIWEVSPDAVNEAKFGYSRQGADGESADHLTAADVGIRRFNTAEIRSLPAIAILGNNLKLGAQQIFDQLVVSNGFIYKDTLSLTRGAHALRLGGEARRLQTNFTAELLQRGQINFLTFEDFLRGNYSIAVAGNGKSNRKFRNWDQAYFVNDTWRLTPHLTLTLGLRYDLFGQVSSANGSITNFDRRRYQPPAPGSGFAGATSTGFVLASNIPASDLERITAQSPPGFVVGDNKIALDTNDPNNFGPRAGFAYQLSEARSLVVRGGYGLYYDRVPQANNFFGIFQQPYYQIIPSGLVFDGRTDFSDPFSPLLNNFASTADDFPTGAALFDGVTTGVYLPVQSIEPDFVNPYVHAYSLNLQWGLTPNLLFEVGYAGSRTRKLLFPLELNAARLLGPGETIVHQLPFAPTPANAPGLFLGGSPLPGITLDGTRVVVHTNTLENVNLRRPINGIQNLEVNSPAASANYNALQASLTKRLSGGSQFLASYTYSRSIDDAAMGSTINSDNQITPFTAGDQTDRDDLRAVSDFDRTHRFVFSYLWELPRPFARGSRWAPLFNGWILAGIATAQSGLPVTVIDPSANALQGLAFASFAPVPLGRASLTGQPLRGSGRLQYLNPAAFRASGGLPGDSPRNLLRGPGQKNVDASLSRRFRFGEYRALDLRAEAFNVFNFVNFANPVSNLSAGPAFGQITRVATAPRMIQFAAKFAF